MPTSKVCSGPERCTRLDLYPGLVSVASRESFVYWMRIEPRSLAHVAEGAERVTCTFGRFVLGTDPLAENTIRVACLVAMWLMAPFLTASLTLPSINAKTSVAPEQRAAGKKRDAVRVERLSLAGVCVAPKRIAEGVRPPFISWIRLQATFERDGFVEGEPVRK